ncbi:SPRY domain-containing protein 3 [Xenopus tropicalis]|uniref:SPRY domain-containing protein 3 n=1 Tax=Xenopus tropicalis TaxID=8364 RepID=A0A8J1J2L2_XENTR|nr:SPRY domain-containing protein 3 [Xenopus tropicalis]
MDDLNLHYRFLNWRRRIREIREVRAVRYQERAKHIAVDGDTLSYHGNSGEVGCYVAPRPLSKDNNYFEVNISINSGIALIDLRLIRDTQDDQLWWPLRLYSGRTKGRQFGTKCSSGDRIGCGIEPSSFHVQTAQIFFTKNGKRVGSTVMPLSPDGLFPAVGMHSLGEEVRLHLNAELGSEEDDSIMMVDSYEDEWGRLHDVRVSGTLLEYVGNGKSIIDVGLAQARRRLSTRSHYFEVEIVDPGEKCYIALGLARKDYPKNRHPGWSRGSVAYHADDGKIFHGSGVGDPFGPRCYKGDIMGCGIMFPRDYILDSEGESDDSCDMKELRQQPRGIRNVMYLRREQQQEEDWEEEEEEEEEDIEREHEGRKVMVFFTRNGKIIGKKESVLPHGGFYPTIGMLSSGEKVKVDLHPLSG